MFFRSKKLSQSQWDNRKLIKGEHVHHIDGNKLNNNPNNLIILSASEHAKIHTGDRQNGKRR
ncbi:HNH endonuclease [Gilliamella sp. B2776]|nr:HNH endonuclease [Gilliamella sp. B2779]MCX8653904.1 HNH endonuclease [Gilliamella sp. B2737]MCX8665339.1 HNH endonuclease [Gilliamella sp. B2887]MCX8691745.1 HNH endonuclease [Gilliamella sp. B2776]MCX8696519.1 HNH endonuclease [Gilliamella sp. B2828]MCX8701228.1 HNH endonuclease [Gilliamella sp. B2840]MCX8703014.1 HNH endonuclease [Gilliamella sp. B2781]